MPLRKAVVVPAKALTGEHLDRLACRERPREDIRDEVGPVAGLPEQHAVIDYCGIEEWAVPRYPDDNLDPGDLGSVEHPGAYVIERAPVTSNSELPAVGLEGVVGSLSRSSNHDRVEGPGLTEALQKPVDQGSPVEWLQNLARKSGGREASLDNGPCARRAG